MQGFLLSVFLLGFVLMATVGAWVKPAFNWPAYFVLSAGSLLALFRWNRGFRFTPSGLCLLSTLLFAGFVVVRVFLPGVDVAGAKIAPIPYLARPDLLLVLSCLMVYVTFALNVDHPKYRRWFVAVLGLLLLVNFGIGAWQASRDPSWTIHHWLGWKRMVSDKSAGGFFHSENHLAGFIVAAVFFQLAFVIFARVSMTVKMVALFVSLLSVVLLGMTTSRGGMAASVGGFIVFSALACFIYWKFLGPQFMKYAGAVGAVAVVLFGVVGWAAWGYLKQRYASSGGISATDLDMRMTFTKMAIQQWKLAPALGTGASSFEHFGRALSFNVNDWNGASHANPRWVHNDYAQLLAEYGLVGFGLGIVFLVSHLGNGLRFILWFRNKRYPRTGERSSNSLALTIGAFTGLAGIAALSIIDFNLHIPANALLVSALCGILANPGFDAEVKSYVSFPGLKQSMLVSAALAGGFTIWKGLRCFPAEWHFERAVRTIDISQYLDALSDMDSASRLDPANYEVPLLRGECYSLMAEDDEWPRPVQMQNHVKAAEQFLAAKRLYPLNFVASVRLAEQLSLLGGYDDADKEFQLALKQAPSIPYVRGRYGMHLIRRDKIEEGLAEIDKALAMSWYSPEAVATSNLAHQLREALKTPAPPAAPPSPPPPAEPAKPETPAPSTPEPATAKESAPDAKPASEGQGMLNISTPDPAEAPKPDSANPSPTPEPPAPLPNAESQPPAAATSSADPLPSADEWNKATVLRIWDKTPHAGFPSLVRSKDRFVCAFREGSAHIPGSDGTLRILASNDGKEWKSLASLREDGVDLRDPKLTVLKDGRLHLLCGGSAYDLPEMTENDLSKSRKFLTCQSRIAFSPDGVTWTPFQAIAVEKEWLWKATWHNGVAWATSYPCGQAKPEPRLTLWKSEDGATWVRAATPKLPAGLFPSETNLRFTEEGTLQALVRNDAKIDPTSGKKANPAWWAETSSPSKEWKWTETNQPAHGPDFIKLPDGRIVYGGRDFTADGKARCVVGLKTKEHRLETKLTLPSDGDCSYPSLLWHEGKLHVLYYSSHEGRAAIYFATVEVPAAASE